MTDGDLHDRDLQHRGQVASGVGPKPQVRHVAELGRFLLVG